MLRGRSRCDDCGAALGAAELVPLLSFLAQRGRCRRCGAAIDPIHPAVELAGALIGAFAFAVHDGAAGPVGALLGWWLLAIALIDLRHHWLPDALTLPLIVAGLAAAWVPVGPLLADRAIGAAAGFSVLAAIGLAYRMLRGREGLGGGDPKLLAALGAWLGWQLLPLVLVGAGLVGIAALLLKRLRGEAVAATDRLPLGSLMVLPAWPIWLVAAAGQP